MAKINIHRTHLIKAAYGHVCLHKCHHQFYLRHGIATLQKESEQNKQKWNIHVANFDQKLFARTFFGSYGDCDVFGVMSWCIDFNNK